MKRLVIWSVTLVFLAACSPSVNKEVREVSSPKVPAISPLEMAVLYVQQSGEYRALCYQAYNLGAQRLLEILKSEHPTQPAVVLDLDETVLDNSPYAGWEVKTNSSYSSKSWQKWVSQAKAGLIPGAGKFLHLCDSLHVAIFYISNRGVGDLDPTLENMSDLHLPQVNSDHVMLSSGGSDKTSRKAEVTREGYTTILYFGDNLGDFLHLWDGEKNDVRNEQVKKYRSDFGSRYIVLPNPVYGTWESASYNFNYKASDAVKDSMRKAFIHAADL